MKKITLKELGVVDLRSFGKEGRLFKSPKAKEVIDLRAKKILIVVKLMKGVTDFIEIQPGVDFDSYGAVPRVPNKLGLDTDGDEKFYVVEGGRCK